jgi:alkanesulfonate monooxygenase SsuD/methylene tetrahydromethanopterin reductase-like flavin-dependent oxidoreductase (luciferase family)
VVDAMRRPGFTLGIGPSHEPLIRGVFGLSYDHPGRSTEEYVRILTGALRGETVDFDGADWSRTPRDRMDARRHPCPCSSRRSARGCSASRRARRWNRAVDGAAARDRVAHRTARARCGAAAGRPAPRIVAGLPVAVHDDEAEARSAAAASSTMYAGMAAYQRILELGGAASPADAAIVGNERSVRAQLQGCSTPARPTSGLRCFPPATTRRSRCDGPPSCSRSSWADPRSW